MSSSLPEWDPVRPLPFVGGFDTTLLPGAGVDVADLNEHSVRFAGDLSLLAACGVRRVRYAVRWHRVEAHRGAFDWRAVARDLEAIHAHGFEVVVDLLHHTSYPAWLDGGLGDPQFGPAFERFVVAFAQRFPWVAGYTLLHEPLTTLGLCGHDGVWPPYGESLHEFVGLVRNVAPALGRAGAALRSLLPGARHVYTERAEHHAGSDELAEAVEVVNDRRFFLLDLLAGRIGDGPFAIEALLEGGDPLLDVEPLTIDVLGLHYTFRSEVHLSSWGVAPATHRRGLAAVLLEYADRAEVPLQVSTSFRGCPSDRATWMKYTLEQSELLAASGVDVESYCWFPFVDSCAWGTLLSQPDRGSDSNGVLWLDESFTRRHSSMSDAYCRAASGATSRELPAFAFSPALRSSVADLCASLRHWHWLPAPADEMAEHARHSRRPG